jgi:hypothetical protein
MRSLTPAEAAVIRSLLADEPLPHRERIRQAGIPARTYEVARQRLLASGWLVERYIPDPVRLGRPVARVSLLRPYAEQFRAVARQFREDPSTVFLWEGPGIVFAVALRPTGRGRAASSTPGVAREFVVDADLRDPTFPVYFDFEGAWSRLADAPGTYRYPRPLAPTAGGADGEARVGPRDRESLEEAVRRPLVPEGPGRTGWFASRRIRRLFAEGAVEHRVFLDLAAIPAYRDRRASTVVFLRGQVRTGASPDRLFRTLVTGCRVTPFLFVTDGERVLLAGLSPAPASPDGAGRTPVLAAVESTLEAIEVDRVPADDLVATVNHRYDRLFGEPTGP